MALVACGGGDDKEPVDNATPVDSTDIADLGDLVTADTDKAAAAEQIGDPATLLAEGRAQAGKVRDDVAAVFNFLKEAAAGEPTLKGKDKLGQPYGIWSKTIQNVDVKLYAVRTTKDRLRYLVTGKGADGTAKPLLTGIFIKTGAHAGGGRFHVNLTNASDLFGAPNADGSMHFWFANHKADKRGRRVAYVHVKDRKDPNKPEANYGADLVRIVGVGGRFRAVGIGDILPNVPGLEAFAGRIQWKAGEGGRGAAVIASLADPAKPVVLGKAQECWDKDGLRTAYKSTPADPNNPDGGDLTMCAGLQQEDTPDNAASPSGVDNDPELDALLSDVGASDISEADASDATDPAGT
jgi:hypothetical protein